MPSGLGDTFENDLVALIFNATAIANIADNAASAPLTNLYVALHTNDVDEAGTQATNEVAYTSYARVARSRSNVSGGWSVSGGVAMPHTTAISFPPCTGSTATASDFSVGVAASSTTKCLFYGDLDVNISISTGVTPQLTTSTTCSIT